MAEQPKEKTAPCQSCRGYGLWAGDKEPMGPMDASDGCATVECPECHANANPWFEEHVSGVVEKSFACSVCGKVAVKIMLLPAGAAHPRAGSTVVEDLGIVAPLSPSQAGDASIVVESFVCKTRISVDKHRSKTISEALEAGDSATICQMDDEYDPAYCPQCKQHYCGDHWQAETVFEDGSYDCTYGTCPHNHKRKLDD